MTKLYDKTDPLGAGYEIPAPVFAEQEASLEYYCKSLHNHIAARESLHAVFATVANESYTLVDAKNQVLFTEYTKLLAAQMGVEVKAPVRTISTESYDVIQANCEIALEGVLGDIWRKIKEFFAKIASAVKGFFARLFVRLDKVRAQLKNLQKVLKETKKDLQKTESMDAPGSIASKFKGNSAVTESVVKQTVDAISPFVKGVTSITKAGEAFAGKDIVGNNFISSIKELREKASADAAAIAENNATKTSNNPFKDRPLKKAIKEETKELKADMASSLGKAQEQESEVVSKGEALDKGSLDTNQMQANKEFEGFLASCEESIKPAVGRLMIGGRTIKSVKADGEKGLEVEVDVNEDEPSDCTFADRAGLLFLVNRCSEMLESVHADVKRYAKVNDVVLEKTKLIDRLISDIDRDAPEKLGRYKNVLHEGIRQRLTLLKKFFSNYNQVGKNSLDWTLDTCEAVVVYSTTSMKYFGDVNS